jgi:hypothetical protein
MGRQLGEGTQAATGVVGTASGEDVGRGGRPACSAGEGRGGKEKMDVQHELPLVDILVLEDERTVSDDAGLQT